MPVTVVFGGQFGSEGKGKVAHALALQPDVAAVVRVGGPNSGHTALGGHHKFRQVPTAAIVPDVVSVIGPGSYVDPILLKGEISEVGLTPDRLIIDPAAVVIGSADRAEEADRGLRDRIGSTLSGTGAALMRRLSRNGGLNFAASDAELAPFVRPSSPFLTRLLGQARRVIVEGTQGHGLSILHTPAYPFATSRDTTAAGLLAEAGLSPVDVDDVVMVIRAFPIRVAGNSGPLTHETSWGFLRSRGHHDHELTEYTTATGRTRRVAFFDGSIVHDAVMKNRPTRIALNHLDYEDHQCCTSGELTTAALASLRRIERTIGDKIALFGWGPAILTSRKGANPVLLTQEHQSA